MPEVVRVLTPSDAAELAELYRANLDFLAPWEPVRPESYYTPAGQRASIEIALDQYGRGEAVPWGIVGETGELIGRVNLSGIVRGAFLSGNLGYWVAEASNGHGYATRAVSAAVRIAFDEVGLHRVQASTLVHNERSQRVLAKAGFSRFGLAPRYLQIAGRWQDHVMFQRLNDAME